MYLRRQMVCNVNCDAALFIDPKDIEEGAGVQILNVMKLPFAKHFAVMPDIHQGYGMPIGGVLATDPHVIIPGAVGVDIGCVDKDTEFLSPTGWKYISNWAGEEVMQFHPNTGKANFIEPKNYIRATCPEFIHLKTKYGVDQMLSEEHRCLVYKYTREGDYNTYSVETAKQIFNKHASTKLGYRHKFNTTFSPNITTHIELTDAELRVMVMVCADGSLSSKNRVRVRLVKPRKIKRFKKLLAAADIKSTENEDSRTFTAYFEPPVVKKGLHQFWKASARQLRIIGNEIIHWDGNEEDQVYFTRVKEEADFAQYAVAASGFRATLRVDKHPRDGKLDYRVFKIAKTKVGIAGSPKTEMVKVPSPDGYKYCFTVPSGYLVLRRNNNIFITGNCGMAAMRTNILAKDLVGTNALLAVNRAIRARIPVGFHKRKIAAHSSDMPQMDPGPFTGREVIYKNSQMQLGTLGGGNHFIELQVGNDNFIWAMVHSGSRNAGKKVCDFYNEQAQERNGQNFSKVEKAWDLAFLHMDDRAGQDYYRDMTWCTEFAKLSRMAMLEEISAILLEIIGPGLTFDVMDIGHNHASVENHMGHNYIVHRKGVAGPYYSDTVGIIPGSMGTSSFIVMMKNDASPLALRSTSHGAGRAMSRKAAIRGLDLKVEQAKLKGILHNMRSRDSLQEAPGSYKDIDKVMADQEELCDIITTLRPILSVKAEKKRRG